MGVHLQEHRPVPALRPFVQRFWTGWFEGAPGSPLAQRVVPSGFLELIIHLTDHHCDLPGPAGYGQSPDYTLIGLQSASYEVRFSRAVEVFAIRFKPAGFYTLFGTPARELTDTHADLADVLGAPLRDFAARIRDEREVAGRLRVAERYLCRAIGARETTYLNRAAELIRTSGGQLRVADVAARLGVSPRQLERAFKGKLGLTPKQYSRVARLGLVQRLVQQGDFHGLADIAYQAGYADQSHFHREFKRLVGHRPAHFLSEQQRYAVNGVRAASPSA